MRDDTIDALLDGAVAIVIGVLLFTALSAAGISSRLYTIAGGVYLGLSLAVLRARVEARRKMATPAEKNPDGTYGRVP